MSAAEAEAAESGEAPAAEDGERVEDADAEDDPDPGIRERAFAEYVTDVDYVPALPWLEDLGPPPDDER